MFRTSEFVRLLVLTMSFREVDELNCTEIEYIFTNKEDVTGDYVSFSHLICLPSKMICDSRFNKRVLVRQRVQ